MDCPLAHVRRRKHAPLNDRRSMARLRVSGTCASRRIASLLGIASSARDVWTARLFPMHAERARETTGERQECRDLRIRMPEQDPKGRTEKSAEQPHAVLPERYWKKSRNNPMQRPARTDVSRGTNWRPGPSMLL